MTRPITLPFCIEGHPFADLLEYRAGTERERLWEMEGDLRNLLIADCPHCRSTVSWPAPIDPESPPVHEDRLEAIRRAGL